MSEADKAKQMHQTQEDQRPDLVKEWNDEELAVLALATAKFPIGTVNRWENIERALGSRT